MGEDIVSMKAKISFNFGTGKYDVIVKDEHGDSAVIASYESHADALAKKREADGQEAELVG